MSRTSQIAKPATRSRAGTNGPSITVRRSPSKRTRLPAELGRSPAAATNTPAETSSSVNRSIAAKVASASGVGSSPASVPSLALKNTITRIVDPPVAADAEGIPATTHRGCARLHDGASVRVWAEQLRTVRRGRAWGGG